MRNFVITCDRYSVLLEGYIELFRRHWTGLPVQTVILGFDKPDIIFPKGFIFHSMGKQINYHQWSAPLITFFESIEDDFFLLCFEDHYLIKDVDSERLDEGLHLMQEGNVDKLYLQPDYSDRIERHYKGNWYRSVDHPHAYTTTSLLPCVWKREYFLKLLRNVNEMGAIDPHYFERVNNEKSPLGCNVLLTKDTTIYANLDAVRKGHYNTSIFTNFKKNRSGGDRCWMKNITSEDMEVFQRMHSKWENQ